MAENVSLSKFRDTKGDDYYLQLTSYDGGTAGFNLAITDGSKVWTGQSEFING